MQLRAGHVADSTDGQGVGRPYPEASGEPPATSYDDATHRTVPTGVAVVRRASQTTDRHADPHRVRSIGTISPFDSYSVTEATI
jgi:hypothetical protein